MFFRREKMERRKEDIFYESLIQRSPFGFALFKIILDRTGFPCDYEFIDLNRTYEKITGFTKNSTVGKTITSIISVKNAEISNRIRIFGEVALNNGEYSFEQYSLPLGKWFKVSVYSPMKHYFVTMFIDITDKKLEQNNIEKFFSLDLDLLCITTIDGNFIKVNSAWENLLGFSKNELENKSFLDIAHPKDIESTKTALEEIKNGRNIKNFINLCACKVGGYRMIEWSWQLSDGLIYASAKDISEHKITETELMREKLLLKTILNGIPDIISLQRPDNTVISYNQAGYDFIGKEPSEVDGKKCYEIMGHGKKCNLCPSERALQLKIPVSVEKYLPEMDVWFDATTIPIFDQNRNITMLVEIMHNITSRKIAENELINAKKIAENASRFKSEFLANMSHEIRTPLNGVIGFTELLRNSNLDPVQKEYAANSYASAHSLLGIINDILDFSKIEAGKLEIDEIKTNIIELVEQAADIVKYNASLKNIEILLNIDPELPRFATVDPLRLKQIMINLLGNAVKFTEKGEVEIKLNFKKTDVENYGKFFFSVRDTGIGITAEQQKNLFYAFSQADASTTRRFGGTGLGLTISNKLLQKMGGAFVVESILEKGSTFSFTIEKTYEYGDPLQPGNIQNIGNVLIIDDNSNNQMILKHTLEIWKIHSETASSAAEGLNIIARSGSFDVVIVDYLMPGMNGIELISMIRELHYDMDIILLHSSSDDAYIHSECQKLNVRHKLTKPIKLGELFRLLSNLKNPDFNGLTKNNEQKTETNQNNKPENPRIMIVEDVALNMSLVKTLLSETFQHAEFIEATDGFEAVEKYSEYHPDIILMDIQMPGKDGYTAAKEIRDIELNSGKRCPIIALTAGAIKGEKERCIEAGMDHFLTKPINIDELSVTIIKYLSNKRSPEKPVQVKETSEPVQFDRETLLKEFNGKEKLLDEFLIEAIEVIDEYVDSLDKIISDNETEKIKRTAHALKGAALNIRFNKLGLLAKTLENTENYEPEIISALLKNIKDEWGSLRKSIENPESPSISQ